MNVPDGLRYTEEHEWARLDGEDEVTVGITDFAQEQLGDVVYVQLPQAGTKVQARQPFGEVESVKTVSDLYSPVGGEVIARNDALDEHPEHVNADPYGEGWVIRVRLTDAAELDALMDADAYRRHIDGA